MKNPKANIEKLKKQIEAENEKDNIMVKEAKTEDVYVACSAYEWLP